jgi:CheY-like chemotaxis protein
MEKHTDVPAVLVVEDDQVTRETLADLLDEVGYTVLTAADGVSALTRLQTHPTPLVVLLDWLLPGMDGMAILKTMAADAPAAQRHVYVLMTARWDEARPLLATLPLDLVVTLVGKPFNVSDLLDVVAGAARHLRRHQGRRRDSPAEQHA